MHALPKPTLVPLCIKGPETRRWLREQYDALPTQLKRQMDAVRIAAAARMDLERPWRIINQRRRLWACHWAGWRPERTSKRWGAVGPKWLGKLNIRRAKQSREESET